jgi:hypothetical protein
MESAELVALKRFRFAKYLESSFSARYHQNNLVPVEDEFSLPDLSPYLLSEDMALYSLGRDIGVFDADPEFPIPAEPPFEISPLLLPSAAGVLADLKAAEIAFQTALLFVQQFNDPKILFLGQMLKSPNSLSDREPYEIDHNQLWLALVSQPEDKNTSPLHTCMAGFIRILDVLDNFRTAFAAPASDPVAKYLAETFKWRLNLHEADVAYKVDLLAEGFFRICREAFDKNKESSILWDEKTSRDRLRLLLSDWRSRTEGNLYSGAGVIYAF